MRCEVLIDRDMFKRGAAMLDAMIAAAPIEVRPRETYAGDCELLMVYGTGHPRRRPWQEAHTANGGTVVSWDLGYWNRSAGAMRLSIGHEHPQHMLRPEPAERWAAQDITLQDFYKPNGHVLIVGIGPKSCRTYGLRPMQWEFARGREALALMDGRRVIYKPKREHDAPLPGFPVKRGPIMEALRGASLVVCRHSNVAVDACIAGVPVVCQDGAAAALYGNDIRNPVAPSIEQRRAFLESLAWWNWLPAEAPQAWQYILSRCASISAPVTRESLAM